MFAQQPLRSDVGRTLKKRERCHDYVAQAVFDELRVEFDASLEIDVRKLRCADVIEAMTADLVPLLVGSYDIFDLIVVHAFDDSGSGTLPQALGENAADTKYVPRTP
jgi:hypothetical protein